MDVLQLAGLAMALVLVGSGLLARRLERQKFVAYCVIWAGIIGLASLAFKSFHS